jgi:ribosomal protein S18 acetylase RimI-like enzyme
VAPPTSGIRSLGHSEIPAAGRLLASAFASDPAFVYALPDPAQRLRKLSWLCERVVRRVLYAGGSIDVLAQDLEGLALWMAVEREYREPFVATLLSGLALTPIVLGVASTRRLTAYSRVSSDLHRAHAPYPHLYLVQLAVRCDRQGRGLGAKLLDYGIARAHAMNLPVYLETTADRTVGLYSRAGFNVAGEQALTAQVVVRALVRPAQERARP